MTSTFHALSTYEKDEWEEYLEKLVIIDVFKDLIHEFPDPETFRCVMRYILYAYSVESDKIHLRMDWHKNKQEIFESVMALPTTDLYEGLVHLKNDAVRQTAKKWLEFQDSDLISEMLMLKDLKTELELSVNSAIRTASGVIDYDQKFKNSEYVEKLRTRISKLESEYIQNSPKLKDAVKELRAAAKGSNSVGIEKYAQ